MNKSINNESGITAQGDNVKAKTMGDDLMKAVMAICDCQIAISRMHGGRTVDYEEFQEIKESKRKCLKTLCAINDPLVRAIAAQFAVDTHFRNTDDLLMELRQRAFKRTDGGAFYE